jgi:hypothetical protein
MRRTYRDDSGLSNVVSLVLITGIITSMMGMVFSTYLPAWGKDVEAQTLYGVMDSFIDLKSSIDQLAVRGDPGTSMTSKITLGSGGGPVFGFGRCTGSLQLLDDEGKVSLSDTDGNVYGNSRGTVAFTSYNTYVEDQTITLEAGMLVREQSGSAVLKGAPNMVVNDDINSGQRIMYILLTTIEGDVRSYSGSETYMISMTLLSEAIFGYDITAGGVRIDIRTDLTSVWEQHFTEMVDSEGIPMGNLSFATYMDGGGHNVLRVTLNDIDRLEVRNAIFKMGVN